MTQLPRIVDHNSIVICRHQIWKFQYSTRISAPQNNLEVHMRCMVGLEFSTKCHQSIMKFVGNLLTCVGDYKVELHIYEFVVE